MQWEAITWERLTDALAEHVLTAGPRDAKEPADPAAWRRVALDGAPAAHPERLAASLAEALRLRGRSVHVVGADGFLRPASLRLEYGHHDPDAYYDQWFDRAALWREVLTPLDEGGTGRVLPDLWDPHTDRATRSPYTRLPPGGVLLLHGPLLLGQWFPFDLTVHLALSPAALARATAPEARWTLPAFARYEAEVAPVDAADVTVRVDHSRRPAWSGPPAAAA